MKRLLLTLIIAVSSTAWAQSIFTGTVEMVQQEGEKIVIDGSEYRITGDALIMIGHVKISLDSLRPGHVVRYQLDTEAIGKRTIKTIDLQVSKDDAEKILSH
ncbi:hypothetical protein [Teredinibacter purpureus]|jgi:hypothetical protein|uniref:hypothetical protein n=1 Tax=Teredinibacter purpureus TaxID=2731756 RepID=UPI0005F778C0|nr:hypothetical protein [Teredinibacter purpureus]